MCIQVAYNKDTMVEQKGLLTNPFDYFVYHVKAINIPQLLTDSKQVHQLSKKVLLCQENLENKIKM